jgi:hypothetical protein
LARFAVFLRAVFRPAVFLAAVLRRPAVFFAAFFRPPVARAAAFFLAGLRALRRVGAEPVPISSSDGIGGGVGDAGVVPESIGSADPVGL